MNRLGWIALGVGFLALLVVVADSRSQRGAAPAGKVRKLEVTAAKRNYYVAPQKPGVPAPAPAIETAVDEARVRSTFLNFRTSVATGNRRLQASLRRNLEHDLPLALRFAEEGVRESRGRTDHEISLKALEALKQ